MELTRLIASDIADEFFQQYLLIAAMKGTLRLSHARNSSSLTTFSSSIKLYVGQLLADKSSPNIVKARHA
jgi:hypothetical protein